jgi:lipoyl(octanoyl) transferase
MGHGRTPRHVELFVEGASPGRWNMDRDEDLLVRAQPAVRLYGWRPACVSLGRTQTIADVDVAAAARHGVDIVPRVTGGGAILHNEAEITYGVVLPLDFPGLPGSILESYRFISQPLVDALQDLGVPAEFGEGKGGRDTLCYLREEGVSVFVEGRKISGGAQRRTQDAVLQHGTLVVERDATRTAEILRAPIEIVERRVTGLDVLGVNVGREELVRRLAARFEEHFGAVREAVPWSGR